MSVFSLGYLRYLSSNFDNHHHRTNPKLGILVPEDNEAGQRVLVYIQVCIAYFLLACHPTWLYCRVWIFFCCVFTRFPTATTCGSFSLHHCGMTPHGRPVISWRPWTNWSTAWCCLQNPETTSTRTKSSTPTNSICTTAWHKGHWTHQKVWLRLTRQIPMILLEN